MKLGFYANGDVQTLATYNIASNGVDITGLENAYNLPVLDAAATVYEADAVKVTWAGLGNNAAAKVENYVAGGKYVAITAPTAAEAKLNAVKLAANGEWTGIPAAGTVMTENVTVTPGYTVAHNIAGVTTNLSIYSDFGLNLFIPMAYADYITVTVGEQVVEPVLVDTDGDDIDDSVRYTKRVGVSAVNSDVAFKIAIAEGEYNASATATLNIVGYAQKILENEGAAADDKQLMYYMLVYANEAIAYFGTEKDSAITAITDAYAGEKIAEQTYSNVITNMGLAPVFEKGTIQLESSPNFVFKLAGGFAGTVTVSDGTNVRVFEGITADNAGYLIYEDMRAYNFASNLTITAVGTYNGDEVNVKGFYNLDTFVNYHVENAATNEASAKCVPLLKAFYDYVVVANAYKAPAVSE